NKKLKDLQKENNILKKKVKYLEEEKRRNNLIFFGIEEQVKEQSMDTYEVIRKVLVPFMKAARKNGHYAKLIKDKLKINGKLFDVEFCLENLNENGENIDESKRLEIKERVRKIVNNSGRNRKGKVAKT
ncbi:hypothetical protein ANN_11484, partial [Periplaneta americana]